MAPAGYSGTPLAKKLGLKEGFIIRLEHAPAGYFQLFSDWPAHIQEEEDRNIRKDFIHYFATSATELAARIVALRQELKENGMLWISWYKKSAGIPSDVSEEGIRKLALAHGLVDVKVCAVDDKWSGLKMVIPLKDRKH